MAIRQVQQLLEDISRFSFKLIDWKHFQTIFGQDSCDHCVWLIVLTTFLQNLLSLNTIRRYSWLPHNKDLIRPWVRPAPEKLGFIWHLGVFPICIHIPDWVRTLPAGSVNVSFCFKYRKISPLWMPRIRAIKFGKGNSKEIRHESELEHTSVRPQLHWAELSLSQRFHQQFNDFSAIDGVIC